MKPVAVSAGGTDPGGARPAERDGASGSATARVSRGTAAGRRRRPAVAAVGVVPLRGSSASGSPHRQKGAESRTGGDGRRALVLSSGSLDHLRRASDGGLPLESVLTVAFRWRVYAARLRPRLSIRGPTRCPRRAGILSMSHAGAELGQRGCAGGPQLTSHRP
jgi:hypothetical protein